MEESGSAMFGVLQAVLVLRVERTGQQDWLPGPLPVRLPSGTRADAAARRTYFDDRAADALYGTRSGCRRGHVSFEGRPLGDAWKVDAAELVEFRSHPSESGVSLVALHCVGVGGGAMPELAQLVRMESAGAVLRHWVTENLAGVEPAVHESDRAFSLVFAQPAGAGLGDAPIGETDWDATTAWLWVLASASTDREFRPPPIDPSDLMKHRFALSADWNALVLRDGAAFLGTHSDREGFLAFGLSFVRSIYLDAFLLGIMQREVLFSMADEVASIQDPTVDLEMIVVLESRASRFRNAFWWNHLTTHGTANRLLTAFQQELRLGELHRGILDELRDYSRQAQLAANLAAAETGERTNRLLAILAVFGIPLAIGQFVAALASDSIPVAVASVAATVLTLGLLLLIPAARQLLGRSQKVSEAAKEALSDD